MTPALIGHVIEAAASTGGALPALPVVDTLRAVSGKTSSLGVRNVIRDGFILTRNGQTLTEGTDYELNEELGIDTWESCLAPLTFASHSFDDFHLVMPLFACRKWVGTPRSREGQALKWVRSQALKDYPMPPADIPLIAILKDWL